MGIAFDATTNGATASGADFSWSHTAGGSAKAAIVLIIANARTADEVVGVTYGGVAMNEITDSPHIHSAGANDSVMYAYFLNNVLTGTRTVAVDLTPPGAGLFRACVITVTTDGGDVEIVDTAVNDSGAGTGNTLDVALVTAGGRDTVCFWCWVSGETNAANAAQNFTEIVEFDAGSQILSFARTDGGGGTITGTLTHSAATGHGFGVALGEVAAQPLTGTTFTKAPTFPTGTVGRGAVNLAGAVFTKAPTFPTGVVGQGQPLTGTTFQRAPTFPQGAITTGAVNLGGTTFTKAPTFPTGVLSAPSLFLAGTLGSDAAGTTFTVDVTRTCVGVPLLIVAAHDGTNIALPTISGGGVSAATLIVRAQSDANPRNIWNFQLEGTLDGNDITITFGASTDGCRAALIDCIDTDPATPFIHGEGRAAGLPAPSTHFIRHQRLASSLNTIVEAVAVGRSAAQSTTFEAGYTELYDVDPGSIIAFAVGYKQGGSSDHKADVTFQQDAPHAPLTVVEVVKNGEDVGSGVTRVPLTQGSSGSGTTANTAAVAATAGRVMVVAFQTERTAASADPTSVQFDPTGTPVSFTKVAAVNIDADRRLHVWAHRFSGSLSAAAIRFTFAATQPGYGWFVFDLLDAAGSGDTDWSDTPVTATGTGTTAAADLTTLTAGSAVIGVFGKDTATSNWTVEEGFVPIDQVDQDGQATAGSTTGNLFVTFNGGVGDTSAGAVIGSSADWAAIALEVLEATASTQGLTGSVFTKAPTFPQGAVTSVRALAGTTFTKAPTFPQGAVTSVRNLAGTTFTKAPTFPQGAITVGAVNLAGVTFQKAPTFPTGVVGRGVVNLAGITFTKAPTFGTGTVGSVGGLVGTTFQKAPTFPTGVVGRGVVNLAGTTFTKAPTFATGAVASGAANLAGIVFQKAPAFSVGTVGRGAVNLAGTTFQKAPTFPTGQLGWRIHGTTFTKAPTFPSGVVGAGAVGLAGVTFVRAPTFGGGTLLLAGALSGQTFVRAGTFHQGTVAHVIQRPEWPGSSGPEWLVSVGGEWEGQP